MDDAELASLRRSLRFFGCVEPVVVNRRSGSIVGGHQRVRAAHEEGFDSLPVVYVDLDAPAERQLNLALNKIHGRWDERLLADLLAELDGMGADLDLTGFNAEEVEALLGKFTVGDGELPDTLGTQPETQQMTFLLDEVQVATVKEAIAAAAERLSPEERARNTNRNGAALAHMAEWFLSEHHGLARA